MIILQCKTYYELKMVSKFDILMLWH